MSNTLRNTAGGLLLAALAGVGSIVVAQTPGNAPTDATGNYGSNPAPASILPNNGPDPMQAGTIPDGPPGLPDQPPGAQGPIRNDPALPSDPSIRDTDPQTQNGAWEQLRNNDVRSSNPAQQQQPLQQQSPQPAQQ